MPAYPPRCRPRIRTDFAIEDGTIDTHPLICPAWACFNIASLLSIVTRGDNYIAPEHQGRTARALVIDQLETSLEFIFDGVQDRDGVTNADVVVGLETNRQDFVTSLMIPPAAPSTRTFSLTLADGTTVNEPIQLTRFRWSYTGIPGLARAVVDVRVPRGQMS